MIRARITKAGKKSYQAIVRIKGYPDKVRTFSTKREAEQNWEIKIKAAMKSGRYRDDTEPQKRSLSDAIERYLKDVLNSKTKNHKTIKGHLLWWKAAFGKYSMVHVTPDLVSKGKDRLTKEPNLMGKLRSPATVNRYLGSLSAVLSIACQEWEWIHESPMSRIRKLRKPRGRVRFLDEAERESLLDACKKSSSTHLYPIVILALSTGMRRGEIIGLKWIDIDLTTGKAVLHETKNGERRVIHIADFAMDVLKKHAAATVFLSSYLFPNIRGNAPINITSSWSYALKQANLKDFRFHDLRHSAASYLAMNGATLAEIAEVLGHKTLAMVKRYAHLSEAHTKGVVTRMNHAIFSKSA